MASSAMIVRCAAVGLVECSLRTEYIVLRHLGERDDAALILFHERLGGGAIGEWDGFGCPHAALHAAFDDEQCAAGFDPVVGAWIIPRWRLAHIGYIDRAHVLRLLVEHRVGEGVARRGEPNRRALAGEDDLSLR